MNQKSLDELFVAWKIAHNIEDEISCEKTFPKYGKIKPENKDFKNSFCVDGFLGEEFNGVLFILKESNTDGNAQKDDFFWFKDGERSKDWKKYRNSMDWYLKNYISENIDYSECAYMNLNKRGGYKRCNTTQLKNYVHEYQDFIKEEIRIINPKHIVCCGVETVYNLVLDVIGDSMTDITIYNCYHLCCRKRQCKKQTKI